MVKIYDMSLVELKRLVAILQEQGVDAMVCKRPVSNNSNV